MLGYVLVNQCPRSSNGREEKKQQLCFSKFALQAFPLATFLRRRLVMKQPLTGANVPINGRSKHVVAVGTLRLSFFTSVFEYYFPLKNISHSKLCELHENNSFFMEKDYRTVYYSVYEVYKVEIFISM